MIDLVLTDQFLDPLLKLAAWVLVFGFVLYLLPRVFGLVVKMWRG